LNIKDNSKKYKSMSGADAVVKGAVDSGAKFLAGYPITPSSQIMHSWRKLGIKNKSLKFLQMEDEIASIHSVIGASLAGLKAFTATSGPGFSLMQEGLGLAFAMQVPLVVFHSQRQGPATGMPTMPAQGDILQTQYGTHGDYASIVFYPNSIKELYTYTIKAFNTAEECKSPVVLLSDAYTTNMHEEEDLTQYKIKVKSRSLEPLTKSKMPRHFSGLTKNKAGIETFEGETYKNWIDERRKLVFETGKKHFYYEKMERKNSKILIIAYGSVSRVVKEIVDENEKFSYFRPITMFPIQKDFLKKICKKYEKIFVVEMNEGQYANQIEAAILREVKKVRVIGASMLKKDILKNLK
jgi:2-oxoglutarate/2-oxoacid ferredoxin oxidoreductase subunit alpha